MNVPDLVRVREVLSPKESDVFTDHGTVSLNVTPLQKLPIELKEQCMTIVMETLTVLEEPLKPWIYAILFESDDINSDWNFWKDAFMSAVLNFIPTKKIKGKNTPPWITSEIIHALDLARQPKRLWSISSRIECGASSSLKRWALAMIISRALKHQRFNRSPSCLTPTLCRSSLYQHLSRPHTPH